MSSTPNARPRTVLYLAESDAAVRDGANALEAVPSGPDRTVQPLSTTDPERLRDWAPEADCVVFAETPTTTAGAALLDVIEACGPTPLVLFTESSFAPTAARTTDGIDGYVRRDADDAVAHLADEIEWICGPGGSDQQSERREGALEAGDDERGTETEPDSESGTANDPGPDGDTDSDAETGSDAVALPGEAPADEPHPADRLLESLPAVAAADERDRLFERLTETAADAVAADACWLSTLHFGELTPRATAADAADAEVNGDALEALPREGPLDEALRTGEPVRVDDLEAAGKDETDNGDDPLNPPLEGLHSLCVAPVGDIGLLIAASETPAAFDADDGERLAAWGGLGAAVLERLETESGLRSDRDRLRRELDRVRATADRLREEREELAAARDRVADERDRARSLFENVPEPALWYEIDDGEPIVRAVNDAFGEVFEADPEAVVDGPLGEETVPPGLEHRQATLAAALRAGQRRQLVSRRQTVDGVREFLLTLVPLEADVDGDGAGECERERDRELESEPESEHNPEGLVVYSDVTEANRTERRLAALEERLETVADLLAEDVRTPLNVARGYLEIAEETGDEEHFAEVDAAQEELRERLEQVFSIARRDAVAVETEPVAVTDVARRAWVAVDTGDARLVTGEDRVLEADKARLRELFEQLLQAAVDREGGGSDSTVATDDLVVTVGAADDGFFVSTTRDDGSTDREAITADATPVPGQLTAADGTGFGLGPVERIADAHGWQVRVADDGPGFVFRGVESADVDGT